MFLKITKDNIDDLPRGFLSIETVKEELFHNPFGKYLLYKEEEVLAYIYYSDIYERAEINQFEVREDKRGCKIGEKLLKKFTEIVEKDVTLEVKNNNDIAIHLYKKYGFVEKAIRKGYYQGVDAILMEKII